VQDGGAAIQNLTDHTSAVNSLDFNSDGTKLVSGSDDKTVKLWNIGNSGILSNPITLNKHTNAVYAVKFSLDGKFIASGSKDSKIKIWDVNDGGALIHTLTEHTGMVTCLSFSPDGKTLASGSHDGPIRLWDMENGGTAIGLFRGHTRMVNSIDFSPDGTELASGSNEIMKMEKLEKETEELQSQNNCLSHELGVMRKQEQTFVTKLSKIEAEHQLTITSQQVL